MNNNLNNNNNSHNNNNSSKVAAIAFTNPVYNMRPTPAHAAQPPLPRTTFICNGYDPFEANARLPHVNNSPNNNRSLS